VKAAALAALLCAAIFLAYFLSGRSVAGAQEEPDPCAAVECVPLADFEDLQEDYWVVTGKLVKERHRADAWRKKYRRLVKKLRWNAVAAINVTFGRYAGQALSVAYCESRWSTRARNGQYLGLFQMGTYARSRYGHSHTAIGQARAAHRYFVASGRTWGPWSCKP
jgi:hypothetical protein